MVCCHAIASSMRKKVAVEKLCGIEDLHLEAVLAAVAQFEPVELTTRRRITLESNSPGCGCRGAGCSAICSKARWCCARVSSLSTLARLVHPRGFRGGSVVFHAGQVRQDQGNPRAATADRGAPRRPTVRPGTVRTSSAHSPPASTRMRAPWSGAPNGPYRSNGAVPDAARVGKVGFVAGAMLVVLGYGILPWMTAVGAGLLIVSGVAVEG